MTFNLPKLLVITTALVLARHSALAALDVAFVLDTTASFATDFTLFQTSIANIMSTIASTVDSDVHFGIVTFEDYGILPFGVATDIPYERVIDLTPNMAAVTTAAAGITPLGLGNDARESYLTAVFQLLNGAGQLQFGQAATDFIAAGQQLNFRSNAQKVVVVWTDAGFNDPTRQPGYPGPMLSTVTAALTNTTVTPPFRFVGLSRSTIAMPIDDLKILAAATQSNATQDFTCFPGTTIAEGENLVCGGVGGSASTITTAFVNMVAEAYLIDQGVFVPLTCAGVAFLLCPVLFGVGGLLSCFT